MINHSPDQDQDVDRARDHDEPRVSLQALKTISKEKIDG
jgi:hypothetical protein